jgi:hypothetical protein
MSIMNFEKINQILKKFEINFSENSVPVYLDENGNKIDLEQIFTIESIENKPVSIIAVTRNQYDTNNFEKFIQYVYDELKVQRHYFGLWLDTEKNKIEYDVSYVIPTNDFSEVQKHLNLHNHLNNEPQSMALVIFPDGNYDIIRNQSQKSKLD